VRCASADEHTSVVEAETSYSREGQALNAEKLVDRCQTIPTIDARTLVEEVHRVAAKSRRWPIDDERAHGAVTVDHDDMRQF
jgi:hypothetical protein